MREDGVVLFLGGSWGFGRRKGYLGREVKGWD